MCPTTPTSPDDYYATLHRSVAEVLDAARRAGVAVTIRSLLRGLDAIGERGPHLERAVEQILEHTPVAARPDDIAHRVRMLAWRRRLVIRLDRLRALALEPAVSDLEVEAELDAFVELAAAQPGAA
ncbi:MAG TPA: hypothetical protein VJT73_02950 [Polyangiaceae bacterium]|nr:hypothetical protein [Polyangiaceae bacterium]